MEYAAQVWDPYLSKHKRQLDAVQRAAARYVKSDYGSYSSITNMLNELEWLSLGERQRLAHLVLLYKTINGIMGVPSWVTQRLFGQSHGQGQSHWLTIA